MLFNDPHIQNQHHLTPLPNRYHEAPIIKVTFNVITVQQHTGILLAISH